MMAVATVDDIGKCCEANTAVSYIARCLYCKLTQSNYRCIDRLCTSSIVDARATISIVVVE